MPGGAPESPCGRCLLAPPAFDRLRAAAPYRGSAKRILLAFKFGGADYLAARLASTMAERLSAPAADEVCAVPATARRRRERGYHPASLLAGAVARRLGLPFRQTRLRKVRETERQSGVPASRRAANVRRAFAVEGEPPARVLLVDDVATSGATARECAARLSAAGAKTVEVWCFARASRADIEPQATEAP
jgi:ComF family protein